MQLNISSIFTAITLLLLAFTSVSAEDSKVKADILPEPLTLDLALSLIDQQHPDLRYIEADLRSARSDLQEKQSLNDLTVNLRAESRWIRPSAIAMNQSTEEQRLVLDVNKTLYDFGRSAAQVGAASQEVLSQQFQYNYARQRQYLNVMKRYFDVVLADLQFYRYNEEMAVAYIEFDRTQIRAKLGQRTELEVAEKNAAYQRIRHLRTQSQNQQRVTRALLAQALNKPNSLPATVARPELDVTSRKLPEIDAIQKKVKENNPVLIALRAKLIAAKKEINYAQVGDSPLLSGGFQAFKYSRESNTANDWQANIILDVPLWSGNQVDAAVAKAKAVVYKIEAQLAQQELAVQQQVLELYLGLETLKIKYDEVVANMDFTELSLDQNRALYELEVKSDLGYSMVHFSEAERKVVKTTFDIALSWAQLDALSGSLLKLNKLSTNK